MFPSVLCPLDKAGTGPHSTDDVLLVSGHFPFFFGAATGTDRGG